MTGGGTWQAVLFDLDGTLTDSGPGITKSVAYALAELGSPTLPAEALRRLIGPPLQESFAAMGVDPVAAIAKYREYFTEIGIYDNCVYTGIPAVLSTLQAAGVRLAVATSKPVVYARRIVEHFDLTSAFEVIHGDELDGGRRHKHQVIAAALHELDLDATSAVMVGDRAADVVGATLCGLPCVGAGWGYGEPGELEAAGAAAIAATPPDLLPLLSELGWQPA